MNLFAISDLHLSTHMNKSMDIFGGHWSDHWEKIKKDWIKKVTGDDIVLVCGDLSWAMRLHEALPDLEEICRMPGKKVLLKGNHDYWWDSMKKIQAYLFNETYLLQNNHYVFGDYLIAGTRGWTIPSPNGSGEDDTVYKREIERLKLSLKSVKNMREGRKLVAMMHFPPFNEKRQPSDFTALLEEAGAEKVIYGHLHGEGLKNAFNGVINGIEYMIVSCDASDFKLKRVY